MSIGNQFSCLVLDLLKTHKLSLFQTYHQNYTEITPFSPYIYIYMEFKLSDFCLKVVSVPDAGIY